MYINAILHFNKEDSEAEVCVSDGMYDIHCYAHPTDVILIGQYIDKIYGFLCTNIKKLDIPNFQIVKLPEYYSYRISAQLMNKEEGIVRVGEIYINLDEPIPKDIVNGDYIVFSVQRLDI